MASFVIVCARNFESLIPPFLWRSAPSRHSCAPPDPGELTGLLGVCVRCPYFCASLRTSAVALLGTPFFRHAPSRCVTKVNEQVLRRKLNDPAVTNWVGVADIVPPGHASKRPAWPHFHFTSSRQ